MASNAPPALLPRVLRRVVGFMHFARAASRATSASIFLIREEHRITDDARGRGPSLIGVKSDWDWTRSSFATSVSSWPTVERALASGAVVTLSREDATGLEVEWFGPRGVVRTACVPLCAGDRHFGAMFFDFDRADAPIDTVFLAEVGRRCARALSRPPARSYRDRWKAARRETSSFSKTT